jgi:hypothetical protein
LRRPSVALFCLFTIGGIYDTLDETIETDNEVVRVRSVFSAQNSAATAATSYEEVEKWEDMNMSSRPV